MFRSVWKVVMLILMLSGEATSMWAQSFSQKTADEEFQWNADRKLVWDDFRGPVPAGRDQVAAETACGMGFRTNTVTMGDEVKVYVYNTFYCNKSWGRQEHRKPNVLQHEQTHFDICELFTRKLREKYDGENITASNLQRVVRKIYNELQQEYIQCQQQYEIDTKHGLIPEEQTRWTTWVDEQLVVSARWASN